MSTYNGHKNWNHWNVSLWMFNDETLYYEARRCARRHDARTAAKLLLDALASMGMTHTPDGARFTAASLYPVIVDIRRA